MFNLGRLGGILTTKKGHQHLGTEDSAPAAKILATLMICMLYNYHTMGQIITASKYFTVTISIVQTVLTKWHTL